MTPGPPPGAPDPYDPGRRAPNGLPISGHARILVVEDSPSARKLMQALLTRLGVGLPELRMAPTVPEALQIFTEWQPQIAFIDLELRPPPDRRPVAATPAVGLPSDGAGLVQLLLRRDPELQIIVCSATDPALSAVAPLVRDGRVQAVVKPIVAARIQQVLSQAAGTLRPVRSPGRSRE
jgi:CheY-like chemotaxis protein